MRVDTHQHFWKLSEVEYSWLVPAYGPLYRTFEPRDLAPHIKAAGIDRTVLVQSANSYEDTASMLVHADYNDWIGAVIGWVDLLDPTATHKRLEQYRQHPKFRGMRHLIHEEIDPDWLMQEIVIESLKVLASFNMIFEVVAVFPDHLKHIPTLSEKIPNLRMAIDHLAKPPIKDSKMSPWSDQLKAAAENTNVYAKISGLNTAADWNTWSASDLEPYIDFAVECFSPKRLMFGSDWPVCILAGDFQKVWTETKAVLGGYSTREQDEMLGANAAEFYHL